MSCGRPPRYESRRPSRSPWTSSGDVYLPDVARLFDLAFRHRRALARDYPHVAVQRVTRERAAAGARPLSIGALVRLWGSWPATRGHCPACGGPALGTCWNGMLSTSYVFGICRRCGLALRRWVGGGIGGLMREIRPRLAHTGLAMGNPWSDTPDRAAPHADLVAALGELGVSGLVRAVGAREGA